MTKRIRSLETIAIHPGSEELSPGDPLSADLALSTSFKMTASRPGSPNVRLLAGDHRTVRLDDQHAYLDVPFTTPLKVGDLISFGISHPCTTFDRWPVMYLADDDLNITGAVRTYF